MEVIQGNARFISVTGDAEVQTEPDQIILVLGVETNSEDLNHAKIKNDDIVKKFIAFAHSQGVSQEYIQTDYLDIEPRHMTYANNNDLVDYVVRKSILLTLKDATLLECILTEALRFGVNYVHEIKFQTTQLKKLRDEARTLAIQSAQLKARKLSKELSLTLGKPLAVHEESSEVISGRRSWWDTGIDNGSQLQAIHHGNGNMAHDRIGLGHISISATVRVKFGIA